MESWAPQPEGLSNILNLLRNAQTPDPQIQRNIHEQLENFKKVPEFNNYLVYIFSQLKNEGESARMLAGILLKNNIKDGWSLMTEPARNFFRTQILTCLSDQNEVMRKTVASIIVTIVIKGDLTTWPTLLPNLVQYIESNDLALMDGAFYTLTLISEDCAYDLDKESLGRPLNVLIPKFIFFLKSPHENIRKYAIHCLNQFIVVSPPALLVNMDNFLQSLFTLGTDPSALNRKLMCEALVTMVQVRVDYLFPYLRNIVQYMLGATDEKESSVAIQACEFWSALSETKTCKQAVREHLPKLGPLLLSKMIYSEAELNSMAAALEQEESEKDVKPHFASSKTKGMTVNLQNPSTEPTSPTPTTNPNNNNNNNNNNNVNSPTKLEYGVTSDGEEEGDGEEYDGEGMSEEEGNQYSLRRSAAAALDMLAGVFGGELLPHILPYLQTQLSPQQQDWRHRECAILALGAIAEGCYEEMKPHLQSLVPFLIPHVQDPHFLIRTITSWTLSRYYGWIVRQPDHNVYLKPILVGLLKATLDDNRRVQEAACSSLATLEEYARADLVPYLDAIVECLVAAFDKYSVKNLGILYDAVGTLAESVRSELNKPAYVAALMGKLIQRWNNIADDERRLLPLLECLQSLAAALGAGFFPYAPHVIQRCLRIVEQTLIRSQLATQGQGDQPDQEFMVCAFDLISGIADGARAQFSTLLLPPEQMGTQHTFAVLLLAGGREMRPDVRQSCYALVGDVARYAFPLLKPVLGDLIPVLIQNIKPEHVGMCNNAIWALGEIAIKLGADAAVFAPVLVEKLLPIVTKSGSNRNLLENTAITIGRVSVFAPQAFAPHLANFAQHWCLVLKRIRDDVEKDSAFRGLCKLIETNPNGIIQHFVFVCDAIASWKQPQPDLESIFSNILHSFRNSMNPQTWTQYFNTFPAPLREALNAKYKLSYQ